MMPIQGSWLLTPDVIQNFIISIRRHTIEAMDNLLFIDIPAIEGEFY